MPDMDQWGRKQQPRRWRKFAQQPRDWMDFPARDWDTDRPRYLEGIGDPIVVYQSCNGYSIWYGDTEEQAPPAEQWIAIPKRPKRAP